MSLLAVAAACSSRGGVFDGTPYVGDIEPRIARPAPVQEPQAPAGDTTGPVVPAVPPPTVIEDTSGPDSASLPAAGRIAEIQMAQASVDTSDPDTAPPESAISVLPLPPTNPGYPNLADVPPRPVDVPTAEERDRLRRELEADRVPPAGAPQ
ncbi:MAG: hypothetical protein ACTS3R_04020 [Inquilinaceae bacterium]